MADKISPPHRSVRSPPPTVIARIAVAVGIRRGSCYSRPQKAKRSAREDCAARVISITPVDNVRRSSVGDRSGVGSRPFPPARSRSISSPRSWGQPKHWPAGLQIRLRRRMQPLGPTSHSYAWYASRPPSRARLSSRRARYHLGAKGTCRGDARYVAVLMIAPCHLSVAAKIRRHERQRRRAPRTR